MKSSVMLSQIKQTKLRSIQTKASIYKCCPQFPSKKENEDKEQEKEIISKHFAVNMDRWVILLKDHTISTFTLPLTVHQGHTLLEINENTEKVSEKDNQSYQLLLSQIQNFMDSIGKQEKGYFVKLSCRSPKDAALSGDRFFHHYQEIQTKGASQLDSLISKEMKCNQIMYWLYQAHTESMHVYSAAEALALLTKSRRIYWDLTYDLRNPEEFSTHIVVREWDPMPMESEIRVFVKNNKITAASQYFTQLFFPELLNSKSIIEKELKNFWEEIESKLPGELNDFVLDLAWVVRDGIRKWLVLEINPFNISTGAALFSWESSHDSDILEGISPFEFRILDSPIAHQQLNKVHPSWIPYLAEFN